MCDPFRPQESIKETIEWVEGLDFKKDVYPSFMMKSIFEACRKKRNIKSPKTIFVPSKTLLRKMILAMIEFRDEDDHQFFLRFGFIDKCNFFLT